MALDKSSFVWKQIDECGRWLASLNVAMRLVDHWLLIEESRVSRKHSADLQKSRADISEWAQYAAQLHVGGGSATFSSLLGEVAKIAEKDDHMHILRWCEHAGRTLNMFAQNNSKLLLENISAICAAYGTVDEVTAYTYAVFVDLEECTDRDLILRRVTEDALRACGVKKHRHLSEQHNPWRTGLWVLLTGNRKSSIAVAVCRRIAMSLSKRGIRYSATIVGQLANDDCVRAYSRSVALAHGFFFIRLSQLRPHLRTGRYNNVITTANEVGEGFISEGQKFSDSAAEKVAMQSRTVTCDTPDAPVKEFVVCSLAPQSATPTASQTGLEKGGGVAEAVVLLCTATDKEDDALAALAHELGWQNEAKAIGKGTFRDLGVIGRSQVYWVRSDMGSSGPGGSFATTNDAIASVKPTYVISCGLAFGVDPTKQELGDVLVSQSVACYEKGRQGTDGFTPRGPRGVPADPFLLQAARVVRLDVRPIRCLHGLMLSGEKLIDDPVFKAQLLDLEPEAIGGEMEGSGIFDACYRNTTRWIIVKGICDWAVNKTGGAQPQAAENAMRVVSAVLQGHVLPVL